MIIPANLKILVEVQKVEEKTDGGLFLPIATMERRKNQQVIGTIVAIGTNCWKAFDDGKPWAEIGDRIFFAPNAGKLLVDPETDKEYLVIFDEDVVALIRDSREQNKSIKRGGKVISASIENRKEA
jgi:co-chaperonin GroES (HSP10)